MPEHRPLLRRLSLHRHTWLVLVLVAMLAQTLGLLHRQAHGSAGHGPQPVASVTGAAHDHARPGHRSEADEHASVWLQQLFSGEVDEAGCALYDQLTHADLLPHLPLLWVPRVLVPAVPPWHAHWQLAAQALGFLARGPPRAA